MADQTFTTTPQSFPSISFAGGLNTTGGPFALSEAESPDLQNVDLNIFGSILKRNGYVNLSTASLGDFNSDGLHWYESETQRDLVQVADGKFYKMDVGGDSLPDGLWDDATNGQTITADNFCDFTNWRNKCFITNGQDAPLVWDGTSLTTATLPAGVTRPKYVELYQNYLFYLNVYVTNKEGSRFYWSDLNDETTFDAANFIRVSDRDGQEITGARTLSDRLVVFKDRSIYNVFATFDADIPFTVQKSNSSVGCVNSDTIQEIENGIVFMAQDGFYFYDGNNSVKISDKVTETIKNADYSTARSIVQKSKNRYICFMKDANAIDIIVVWDYSLNAWTLYRGISVSAIEVAFIDGTSEALYFVDAYGWTYRMDYGLDDYPLGVRTAIDAYYYTNWKPLSDIVLLKSIPMLVIYHTIQDSTVQLVYSYDFDTEDQFTEDVQMIDEVGMIWDDGYWDEESWDAIGGMITVKNIDGRGRIVRFGFKNNSLGETFRIDGIGIYARGETFKG